MLPKKCTYCRDLFVPTPAGLSAVFCSACVSLCEETYQRIRQYLQQNPNSPALKVIMALGIPAVFVHHLFRSGRLSPPDLSRRQILAKRAAYNNTSTDSRPCQLCHKALKPGETVYCQPCNTVMEKRMHTQYRPTGTGVQDPLVKPRHPQEARPNRYGFGKQRP